MITICPAPTRVPPKWKVNRVLDVLKRVDECIDKLLDSRLNNDDEVHIRRLQRELWLIADKFEINFIKRYKKIDKNAQKM